MRKFLFIILMFFVLFAGCKTKPEIVEEPEPEVEIVVLQPLFEILSIAIIKAELINTQFEAVLKIENPNDFAVDLSTLTYELYGNGLFWASGTGFDVMHISAGESEEAKFLFSMNFINMNRRLLDDIIALRQVNYRFSGAVEVAAVLPLVPSFNMSFERSGLSVVKENLTDEPRNNGNTRTNNIRYIDNW